VGEPLRYIKKALRWRAFLFRSRRAIRSITFAAVGGSVVPLLSLSLPLPHGINAIRERNNFAYKTFLLLRLSENSLKLNEIIAFGSTEGYNGSTEGYNSLTEGYNGSTDGYNSSTEGYNSSTDAYNTPTDAYNAPTDAYNAPTDAYNDPTDAYNAPTDAYNTPTDAYNTPTDAYNSQIIKIKLYYDTKATL
jgi:hypothetical protein